MTLCARIFRLLLLSFFLFAMVPTLRAQSETTEKAENKSAEKQRALDLDSFEMVWSTVRDKHWDPKLDGVDWNKVREEFLPKIKEAKDRKEVRKLLSAMLGRLGKSHFGIVPGEVYDAIAPQANTENVADSTGTPGFNVRVVDGQALVFQVEKGSPAQKLGVHPGWEILQVDGKPLAPVLEKVAKTFKGTLRLERELSRAVEKQLNGTVGKKVPVVFRDAEGKEVPLEITLVKLQGSATNFGHLPTLYVHYEAKKLPGDIAYFALNTFADPTRVMAAFEKTVLANLDAKGFIIDLRGNPGGIGIMAAGMSSWFVDSADTKLGTMIARKGKLNFVLNKRRATYTGPLAVLVDGLSASTSEIMAGGLQDLKRARIFGTTTLGAALPSVFERLPNGDGFQYAIANYISVGGKPLEGRGVVPDQVVTLSRESLLNGNDPVIDAAVAWIEKQAAPNAPK